MTKNTLGIFLAAQLILVLVVWGLGQRDAEAPQAFLSFDSAIVDKLSISDGETSVELLRIGEEWKYGDDVPANKSKIEAVLKKLSNTSVGWPVGTTGSAAERFEVTDNLFQRRLVAKAGEALVADIYLGTSPSFRKVHARHASGGPVYSIDFSNYEVGAEENEWLDKGLFRPRGSIAGLERKGQFVATKRNGTWSSGGDDLSQSEINKLAARFEGLSVTEPSDFQLPPDPWIQYSLDDEEGTQLLSIYRVSDENNYAITSDRTAGVYGLSSFVAEQLDVQLSDLLAKEDSKMAVDEIMELEEES